MVRKRILSVGQCMADHTGLSWTFKGAVDAEVVPASSAEEALALLREDDFDLVLVNRVFDADGDSGVDFIRRLKAEEGGTAVPVMLVSNYADAQAEAVRAGARPGFGKAALGQPEVIERVIGAMGK